MERLDAAASERAGKDGRRFHAIRSAYLKTFGGHLAALESVTQMKFRTPMEWTSNDHDASCTYSGYGFPRNLTTPWLSGMMGVQVRVSRCSTRRHLSKRQHPHEAA